MESFTNDINVENKSNFIIMYQNYYKKILRESIYINIIKNNENDYFDIDLWVKKNNFDRNIASVKDIIDEIIIELNQLGWNCKYSYGDTVLFIYSTEDPPKNCYNHEYI